MIRLIVAKAAAAFTISKFTREGSCTPSVSRAFLFFAHAKPSGHTTMEPDDSAVAETVAACEAAGIASFMVRCHPKKLAK